MMPQAFTNGSDCEVVILGITTPLTTLLDLIAKYFQDGQAQELHLEIVKMLSRGQGEPLDSLLILISGCFARWQVHAEHATDSQRAVIAMEQFNDRLWDIAATAELFCLDRQAAFRRFLSVTRHPPNEHGISAIEYGERD